MKKIIFLIAILFSVLGQAQNPSIIKAAGVQVKGEGDPGYVEITMTTNSISTTWTLNTINNSGNDLLWSVTGDATRSETAYAGSLKPTYDFSLDTGLKTIHVVSTDNLSGVTLFSSFQNELETIDLSKAVNIITLEVKDMPNILTTDITSLVNLESMAIRDNPLQTSLDLSGNPNLWNCWIYGNAFTTIDISENDLLTTLSVANNNLTSASLDAIVNQLDAFGLSGGKLYLAGNTGSLTEDSYNSFQSLKGKAWTIDVESPSNPTPIPPGGSIVGSPTLSNFHIKDGEPLKLYFNSSEIIIATNTTGFFIGDGTGKTISASPTINTGNEIDHYFTVSSSFDFWDNSTLRYVGGSNIADSDSNPVLPFTLSYIENRIAEPDALTNKYVNTSASGDGSGDNESNYATLATAFSTAVGGETWWIKAGVYSSNSGFTMNRNGSVASPLVFKGYNTDIGDLDTDTFVDIFVYGSASTALAQINGSLYPVIDGIEEAVSYGIENRGDYTIFKNIHVKEYRYGVFSYDGNYQHYENMVFAACNDPSGGAGFRSGFLGGQSLRVINSIAFDNKIDNIWIHGNGSMVKDCKTYSGMLEPQYTDYQIVGLPFANGIIKDNYCWVDDDKGGSIHGIGLKQNADLALNQSHHSLIDNNTIYIDDAEALYAAHMGTSQCVYKNNNMYSESGRSNSITGIGIRSGAQYNIFENNYFHNGAANAVTFSANTEVDDCNYAYLGIGNIVRNNIFNGAFGIMASFVSTCTVSHAVEDNLIYNNTFYNVVDRLFYIQTAGVTYANNEFKNNIIYGDGLLDNIYTNASATDFTQQYNNYYNIGVTTPSGTGNISVNPTFEDLIDFHPTNTLLNSGTPLTGVEYDFAKLERDDTTPTIGAVENTVVSSSDNPVISNIHIKSTQLSRVYFDANETITGNTTGTGFKVSGKTVTNFNLGADGITDHYLTVSTPFTWWDNNTLRYEGNNSLPWVSGNTASNIADVDSNPLLDFTMEYITNYISEPIATTQILYVSATASGGNGTIGSPYTIVEADANAANGTTIYVKSGLYNSGAEYTFKGSSDPTSPIKWIGYDVAPGDLDSDYTSDTFSYVNTANANTFIDSGKFPLIYGNGTDDIGYYGIWLRDDNNIIFKNFQVENYAQGVYAFNGSNIHFENVLAANNIYSPSTGNGTGFSLGAHTQNATSNNIRAKKCIAFDNGGYNYRVAGSYNLVIDSNASTGLPTSASADYEFSSYNLAHSIFIGCRVDVEAYGSQGHAFAMKNSAPRVSSYVLFVDNYAKADGCEMFAAAHQNTTHSVFKNNIGLYGDGITIRDGANRNVYENNYFEGTNYAMIFWEGTEDQPNNTGYAADNNVIRNNIFNGSYNGVVHSNTGGVTIGMRDNKIYNNTFYNVSNGFFYGTQASAITFSGNEFKNNILYNCPDLYSPTGVFGQYLQEYNDYYLCESVPGGTGNINVNPSFTTTVQGGFVPTNTALNVGLDGLVDYDLYKTKRKITPANNVTIGAVEIPN